MNKRSQHSALQSIILHLLPGMVVLGSIFIFPNPIISKYLGVDDRLAPVVGYLFGLIIELISIQLAILLLASRKEIGRYSLKGLIGFTQKSKIKDYVLHVPSCAAPTFRSTHCDRPTC